MDRLTFIKSGISEYIQLLNKHGNLSKAIESFDTGQWTNEVQILFGDDAVELTENPEIKEGNKLSEENDEVIIYEWDLEVF